MGEVNESLLHASNWSIMATGLVLGIVHVITGPDHLSALIVLSAGSSWRSAQLGMRWGFGHSTGLLIVTTIFLAVGKSINLDNVSSYCDFVVGILMVTLGIWGFHYYLKMRTSYKERSLHPSVQESEHLHEEEASPHHEINHHILQTPLPAPLECEEGRKSLEVERKRFCGGCCANLSTDLKNPHTTHLTSFLYGIAHGLAGTGGILGVLPAVMLNDWYRSFIYLLSFCVASIFIMSVFAATYGEVTGRLARNSDQLLYHVGLFSSSISLLVGLLWIILVSLGQLDAVFG